MKNSSIIYVLDTSVILHDHNALYNFEEHDVAIPITVLEELDNFKRGSSNKNYEAREFIRILDKLAVQETLKDWMPICEEQDKGKFKILMTSRPKGCDAGEVFARHKADHHILNAALNLKEDEKDKKVILVSKDINLRLKAKALDLPAEDYMTGKVDDVQNLYSGRSFIDNIPSDILAPLFAEGKMTPNGYFNHEWIANHYYVLKNGTASALGCYNAQESQIKRVEKTPAYGVKPKNAEQIFALDAILNPKIKLVSIQGVAGTGKTLLALAGSLEQRANYKQIVLARPIIPLSNQDIGYLPGDAQDKINPYMEPLWDNLKFIKNQFSEKDLAYKRIEDMLKNEKIVITPLAYIRGRSLANIIMIIDEAQNLTPHEVKTIITRAGENTKIIFTGDVRQIDTPYLDEQSNGLSYLIERIKGNELFAHVTLEKGERSELANVANQLL